MSISALILTKNEEEMIEDCLRQLHFLNEIIVCDQNSTDKTREIAQKYTKNILRSNFEDFSKNRNLLAKEAKGDWLLYVDADERLDEKLIDEIKKAVIAGKYSAFYISRKNIILGKWLRHGGWWPDYVPRLFKRSTFKEWQGKVHESPIIEGEFGRLKYPILHYTARSLEKMLKKSTTWGKTEADLYTKLNTRVTILTIIKAMTFEFLRRYFAKRGFLDGIAGLIESLYQATHQAIVLTYLWEIQNDVKQKYRQLAV